MISQLPFLSSIDDDQRYLVRQYHGNIQGAKSYVGHLLTSAQTMQRLYALCDHVCTGEKDDKLFINFHTNVTVCGKCNFFVHHSERCWKSYQIVPNTSFWNWISPFEENDLICVQTIVLDILNVHHDASTHVMHTLHDYEYTLNHELHRQINLRLSPLVADMMQIEESIAFQPL